MSKSTFSPHYERFRQMLIEARDKADLTQVQLSERLSKPQSYVSKYERGERRLDVIEFFDIAQALGIDALEFLGRLYNISSTRQGEKIEDC